MKKQIDKIHEIYLDADPDTLRQRIAEHFIPTIEEKKGQAEVPTPVKLVDEMLDKIPEDFWTSPKRVLEPCCGKGNFVLGIYDKFLNGLEKMYPDKKDRHRVIVEDCLWFCDISPLNVFITTELVRCHSDGLESKNTFVGDTLQKSWDFQFDAVIGNPPYNSAGRTASGNTIWQNFVDISLNTFLSNDGLLVFVHPRGWIKPNTPRGKLYNMYDLMCKKNQMLYLSIHGIKDGQKTFNCGTRYDWYIINHRSKYTTTIVIDENGKELIIDMSSFEWLPNYNIDTIQNILAKKDDQRCPIIYSRSNYGSDKKYTQKNKSDKFKYPIIHTIPKTGIRYIYSSCNDKGHFRVSKVIFGQTNCENPYIDMDGKYGMSEHSMAIKVSSIEEAKNIEKCLKNEKFISKVLNSCLWSNFMIDWRLFTYFKKDFWKEFI